MKQPIFAHKDQYDRELEWLKLRAFFERDLIRLCHTNVLDLEATFAYSDEPTPFEEISSKRVTKFSRFTKLILLGWSK